MKLYAVARVETFIDGKLYRRGEVVTFPIEQRSRMDELIRRGALTSVAPDGLKSKPSRRRRSTKSA